MTGKTAILHPIGEEGAAATGAPLRRQRQPAVPLPRQGEHLPSPGGVAPITWASEDGGGRIKMLPANAKWA